MDLALSEPAYGIPPPKEMTKFSPPVINDDAVEEDAAPSSTKNVLLKNKKIIKDGSMSIKVKDIEAAKKRIDGIVKIYDCYYENEGFENFDFRISYDLKIRVPAKQFETFLKASEKGDDEIINKIINARDVTEEYVDGETRLNSKRMFRNRYNQLLEKAAKVDDILAIDENIRILQEEIESQEGHLKFLNDQITYSTLEINLFYEKTVNKPTVLKDSFIKRFIESLNNGWNTLVNFVLWCIMQWPWYILVTVAIIILKLYLKKRKK
jgi:hypothetical protein